MQTFKNFTQKLDEKFSDIEYVIDQLINSMEHYDEKSWIEHMSSETDLPSDVLREIWKEWVELSGQVKGQNAYGWKKWLDRFGIKESVKERYDVPKYKGRPSAVRGGVAMTDDSLGRMRIMMRNISKLEGVDVLASEISTALSSSEIQELKRLL